MIQEVNYLKSGLWNSVPVKKMVYGVRADLTLVRGVTHVPGVLRKAKFLFVDGSKSQGLPSSNCTNLAATILFMSYFISCDFPYISSFDLQNGCNSCAVRYIELILNMFIQKGSIVHVCLFILFCESTLWPHFQGHIMLQKPICPVCPLWHSSELGEDSPRLTIVISAGFTGVRLVTLGKHLNTESFSNFPSLSSVGLQRRLYKKYFKKLLLNLYGVVSFMLGSIGSPSWVGLSGKVQQTKQS